MSKGRLQQVDIPLEEEVNKHEEDFSDFKTKLLGIQVLEEEVVETPSEKVEDNNTECQKKAPLEIREQVNYTENDANSRGLATLFVQQGHGENQGNIWYLDSRASNHMCGQQDLFGDLDEAIQGLVTFRDTSKVPFKVKGNIPIKLKNGDHSYIADVYYVPAIKQNLVSIG
ncbi:PREDICTED: uncharacterized protein LOC105109990 [Populus euphratica]|uniref:Uncharacterized protein LOC105109990 n=1 Tax=Populus euphratica TaxID=75702 RepID=A0AAJ6X2P2_POPEU|nr:PREDICTED: uncharacterized protein LOC105109990 [Populus euphratica]